jgi:hypothetical protein
VGVRLVPLPHSTLTKKVLNLNRKLVCAHINKVRESWGTTRACRRAVLVAFAGHDVLGHLLELNTMVIWSKQHSKREQQINRWAAKGKRVMTRALTHCSSSYSRPNVKLPLCPYGNPSRFIPLGLSLPLKIGSAFLLLP